MEINELQHPDSIWTWKSNKRGRRSTVWLPYVSEVTRTKKPKWKFKFNGGELETELSKVDCLMFYGATGSIPVELIDELAVQRIPLIVHRRNIGRPAVFLPAPNVDADDILTSQILVRVNETKRNYLARTFIRERFLAIQDVYPLAPSVLRRLSQSKTLKTIRAWEAEHSKKYWSRYFSEIGYPDISRRSKGPVQSALNAGSMFLSGIILRWALLHRLSPSHGYLHQGTDYAALIYDLMEPSRYLIENAVSHAVKNGSSCDTDNITKYTLSGLKASLEEIVYVPATRQHVRRKNLLHGSVLALRAYLSGDMRRFVIPVPGSKRGGRPPNISYRLPGSTHP